MKKIFITVAAIAACALVSCEKEAITVDHVDEAAYANVGTLVGSLRDLSTNKTSQVVEIRSEEITRSVVFALPRAAAANVQVKVALDAEYLREYNEKHGTSFELFPSELVAIQDNGEVTVEAKKTRSGSLDVTLSPLGDKEEKTYLLPLKASTSAGGVKVSEERVVYLVKNMAFQTTVSTDDPARKKVNVWIEVNNTNPLNMLQFETEDGHLLIDHLVLFAYNINYDAEKGKVYCFANPQCQYILDHYNEIVRPLRERGMKVFISVLGNHDASGLAQLSDAGARAFAQEMKALCEGYGFDGVNYDDEYSNSPDLSIPWFTSRSQAAGNRLYYETWKAMPDKEMMSYQYGSALGNAAVDGVEPGEYMAWAVGDYGRRGVAYSGMTNAQVSYQSSEFAQWRSTPTESTVSQWMASDYGLWMIFSLWNDSKNLQRDWNAMNILSKAIYGCELKKPTKFYPQTKSLDYVSLEW